MHFTAPPYCGACAEAAQPQPPVPSQPVAPEGYVLTTGLATGLPEDLVREVAAVLDWYGSDMGQLTQDAAARAILQARAWELRRQADEARHAKRHEQAAWEMRTLLDLAEARRRTRRHMAIEDVR